VYGIETVGTETRAPLSDREDGEIKKPSPDQQVQACLNHSDLWSLFEQLKLKTNVRVQGNDVAFKEWPITVGDGNIDRGHSSIREKRYSMSQTDGAHTQTDILNAPDLRLWGRGVYQLRQRDRAQTRSHGTWHTEE
jgi:hypothetical protein